MDAAFLAPPFRHVRARRAFAHKAAAHLGPARTLPVRRLPAPACAQRSQAALPIILRQQHQSARAIVPAPHARPIPSALGILHRRSLRHAGLDRLRTLLLSGSTVATPWPSHIAAMRRHPSGPQAHAPPVQGTRAGSLCPKLHRGPPPGPPTLALGVPGGGRILRGAPQAAPGHGGQPRCLRRSFSQGERVRLRARPPCRQGPA